MLKLKFDLRWCQFSSHQYRIEELLIKLNLHQSKSPNSKNQVGLDKELSNHSHSIFPCKSCYRWSSEVHHLLDNNDSFALKMHQDSKGISWQESIALLTHLIFLQVNGRFPTYNQVLFHSSFLWQFQRSNLFLILQLVELKKDRFMFSQNSLFFLTFLILKAFQFIKFQVFYNVLEYQPHILLNCIHVSKMRQDQLHLIS